MQFASLKSALLITGILASLSAFDHTARAQVLNLTSAITNPSFESDPQNAGGFSNAPGVPTGYQKGADIGVARLGDFGAPNAGTVDGAQYCFLGNGANFTNLFQDFAVNDPTLASATSVSFTLTLGFAVRNFFSESTTDPNGTINLGIEDRTNFTTTFQTQISRASLVNTGFQDFSVTLPASAGFVNGDTLRIYVDKLAGNGLIVIDNFRLSATAVPEPGTVSLLALGGAGLAVFVRRRRTAAS